MAERIVSPGVFVNEIDQSQLPRAVDQIGAAIIGPTVKGPALVPTKVRDLQEYIDMFGGYTDESYVPYTVNEYFRNGGSNLTVTRLLYEGGYSLTDGMIAICATTGSITYVTHILAPTQTVSVTSSYFSGSSLVDLGGGSFTLTLAGNYASIGADASIGFTGAWDWTKGTPKSCSIVPTSNNYVTKIFGQSPKSINYPTYVQFDSWKDVSYNYTQVTMSLGVIPTYSLLTDYQWATTPWIQSQVVSDNKENLFRFHTISHGTSANHEVWVGIRDIRTGTETGDAEGYGSFTVVLRRVNTTNIPVTPYASQDSDAMPDTVETYENVNLNPKSANYIARRIGTKYMTINDTGEVTYYGDYDNISRFVRVEVAAAVDSKALSSVYIPFGHAALKYPHPDVTATYSGSYGTGSFTSKRLTPPAFRSSQTINNQYSPNNYYGFYSPSVFSRNAAYLAPIYGTAYTSTFTSTATWSLADQNQAAAANYPTFSTRYSGSIGSALTAGEFTSKIAISTRKFMVPFQGGFDGLRPNAPKYSGQYITAANTFGFDCTDSTSSGSIAYGKAFTLLSNTDYYDLNLLITPGIIDRLHSSVTAPARNLVEQRGDAFYVMDSNAITDSITTVISQVAAIDSSYTATYWPWVKVIDTTKNLPVWVPPSVVIPGVLAFNDKVSAPWYAPAGLTRGGLTSVTQTYSNLNRSQRDDLYFGRVNPIANFPNDGVVVWGQKTLQITPSALDRVNVRRLLITVKKYIASATRYLVFEQNTASTRQRFVNIVNPYLDRVKQQQGLYAFRVIMDESNNTADLIDQNILYGQLFLQPTRTAEFIILDFNIQPTGADFGGQ
jgi:phage tail sheath protein FI